MAGLNGETPKLEMNDALPTKAEYDAMTPYQKGYCCYMFAAWPGSEIPPGCPFDAGAPERAEFERGDHDAMMDCQEIEG